MKISKLLKPIVIGSAATAAVGMLAPEYTTIAAAGSGAYVLFTLIYSKDAQPKTLGVTVDRERNKIVAIIRNPGKKTITIRSEVRLKGIIQPPADIPMMRASAGREGSTLIGECDFFTIEPGQIAKIEHDLLVPNELIDSSDGIIQVKTENIKPPKVIKSKNVCTDGLCKIETEAVKKIDETLEKIESKAPQDACEAKSVTTIPQPYTDQKSESVLSKTITTPSFNFGDYAEIVVPNQVIEIIDETEAVVEDEPTGYIEACNIFSNVDIIYSGEEYERRSIPAKSEHGKRPGKSVGVSQSMLNIIIRLNELNKKNAEYLANKDAI